MLVRPSPMLSSLRRSHTSSTSDTESVEVAITDDNDRPTSGTVPAVGTAHGHVLLPPKTQAAVAAVAAGHVESSLVPKAELLGAPSPVPLLLVDERRVSSDVSFCFVWRRRQGRAGREDERGLQHGAAVSASVSIAASVAAYGVWRSMSSSSDAYACYYRVYAQRGAALNFHPRLSCAAAQGRRALIEGLPSQARVPVKVRGEIETF